MRPFRALAFLVTGLVSPLAALTLQDFPLSIEGDGSEVWWDVAVSDTAVYFIGVTTSSNLPVTTGDAYGGGVGEVGDALVAAADADGNLLWLRYLGGSGRDFGNGIALAADGSVVVAGWTDSPNFPRLQAIQATLGGGTDGFIAVLDPGTGALRRSTTLGGSQADEFSFVTVTTGGIVAAGGYTNSTDFPFPSPNGSASDGTKGATTDADGLVYFLGADFAPLSATYLDPQTGFNTVVLDGTAAPTGDTVFVTGWTNNSNFYRTGFKAAAGGQEMFVLELDPATGGRTGAQKTMGGSGDDVGLAVTATETIVAVVGSTTSTNYPATSGSRPQNAQAGGKDVLVHLFSFEDLRDIGGGIATYLGGSGDEEARDVAARRDGAIELVGITTSPEFPLPSEPETEIGQPQYSGGGGDGFVLKLRPVFGFTGLVTGMNLVDGTFSGSASHETAFNTILESARIASDLQDPELSAGARRELEKAYERALIRERPRSGPTVPDLEVSLQALSLGRFGLNRYFVGDEIRFHLRVTNHGPDPTTDVGGVLSVPTFLEFVEVVDQSAGIITDVLPDGSIRFRVPQLAVDESVTLTVTYQPTEPSDNLIVTAALDRQVDPIPSDNTATFEGMVTAASTDLAVYIHEDNFYARTYPQHAISVTIPILNLFPQFPAEAFSGTVTIDDDPAGSSAWEIIDVIGGTNMTIDPWVSDATVVSFSVSGLAPVQQTQITLELRPLRLVKSQFTCRLQADDLELENNSGWLLREIVTGIADVEVKLERMRYLSITNRSASLRVGLSNNGPDVAYGVSGTVTLIGNGAWSADPNPYHEELVASIENSASASPTVTVRLLGPLLPGEEIFFWIFLDDSPPGEYAAVVGPFETTTGEVNLGNNRLRLIRLGSLGPSRRFEIVMDYLGLALAAPGGLRPLAWPPAGAGQNTGTLGDVRPREVDAAAPRFEFLDAAGQFLALESPENGRLSLPLSLEDGELLQARIQPRDGQVVVQPAGAWFQTVVGQATGFAPFAVQVAPLAPGTGAAQGLIYLEREADGAFTPRDAPAEGQLVYLDLDGDGRLGITEPRTFTGPNGGFVFRDLLPGPYRVVAPLPPGAVANPARAAVDPGGGGVLAAAVAVAGGVSAEVDGLWFTLPTGEPATLTARSWPSALELRWPAATGGETGLHWTPTPGFGWLPVLHGARFLAEEGLLLSWPIDPQGGDPAFFRLQPVADSD